MFEQGKERIMDERVDACIASARRIRQDIIRMTHHAGSVGAHIGGSLSLVEVMAVLYSGTMRCNPDDFGDEMRDRLILSKGHGVMAQYAAMKDAGLISEEDLLSFKADGSPFSAHPSMNMRYGIEFSSGSLGQGLSLGVGVCLALKRKGNHSSKAYVVLGDGECDEGQIWEAASSASHYGLANLVVIVDCNHLQYDGPTETVMDKAALADRWRAFGWTVREVDGHRPEELICALETPHEVPLAVIAHTVKGKGVSFMEGVASWHNGRLNDEQFEQAMAEQEADR